MTPGQSSFLKKAIVAALVLAPALFLFDWTRWWVFETRINNQLRALPDKPLARDILAVKPGVLNEARSLWISEGSLALEVHLEQQTSNAYAAKEDMIEPYWFVIVTVTRGKRQASWKRRIDNKVAETDTAALEKGGVRVVLKKKESG